MKRLLIILTLVTFANKIYSTTCTSIADGEFSADETWDCGHAPADGDIAIVASGHTVTLTAHASRNNFALQVYGTLSVNAGKKLTLDATSTVQVFSGGMITGANGGSQISLDAVTVWSGGAGNDINYVAYAEDGMASFAAGALPIKLISFKVSLKDKTRVELTWITEAEINNNFFTVERSTNGLTFTKITTVKGAGNSSNELKYSSVDDKPVEGNAYYRLKQTDFDGKFSYSDIVAVNYDVNKDGGCVLKIYPNPCMGKCNVDLSGCDLSESPEIKVEMIDAAGQKVYSTVPYRDEKGSFSFSVDTENNLKPGVYIVSGTSKNEKYNGKLLVK